MNMTRRTAMNAVALVMASLRAFGRGWVLPLVLVTAILSGALFASQQVCHDTAVVGAGSAAIALGDVTTVMADPGGTRHHDESPFWACLSVLIGLLEDFAAVVLPARKALLIAFMLAVMLVALTGRLHRRSPSLTELCLSRT
jgi:hypothetical protein